MLARIKGRIVHKSLDRASPLAVPVLLEVGREQVHGSAMDELLAEAERELIGEAMSGSPPDADGPGRVGEGIRTPGV